MDKRFIFAVLVTVLLTVGYLQTAWGIFHNHQVSFINYTAQTPSELWALKNLAARLIGISIGFIIALALRNRLMLALMFAVRLSADSIDCWTSWHTQGVDASVGVTLLVVSIIELLVLGLLLSSVLKAYPAKSID